MSVPRLPSVPASSISPAMWEIVFGISNRNEIRAEQNGDAVSLHHGPVLHYQPSAFWISWFKQDSLLRVGTGEIVGENEIMKAPRSLNKDVTPNYVYVATEKNSGAWKFKGIVERKTNEVITTDGVAVDYAKGFVGYGLLGGLDM